MFDQREQRPLAVVKRDEVDIVEDAGIGQAPQFGIGIAAAQCDRQVRLPTLDGLGDAERSVQIAGKRHGEADQCRLDPVEMGPEGLQHERIGDGRRRVQRVDHTVE